ncbi:MAG: PHB depolymerase family esterase [Micromonosporaceae bacterium]|nr:PHB depolymerase family esterase [Micromonosporaceae bacterium]
MSFVRDPVPAVDPVATVAAAIRTPVARPLGRLAALAAALLVTILAVVAVAVRPARAATLTPVTNFGSNPGNLNMYVYRPDGLGSGAPVVVAMHGCSQDANTYYTNSGWPKYADLFRFIVIFPEQKSANAANACFNWFTAGDVARGQGEALSVKQMVDYAQNTYGADPNRTFVTGLSAGGAFAAVMLATYPDVFEAGSIVAGIPYGCAPATSPYICMFTTVSKTPAQWGNLVRNAFPGYSGPYPRVSIWHGTSDAVVVPGNANSSRDQWTNVWGISTTPTSTASLPANTTVENYDSGGQTVVRVQRVAGMGHGTPVDPGSATHQCGATGAYFLDTICSAYYDALFFGLDGGSGPTTSPTASPTSPTSSPTTPPTGPCFTASNYAHTVAGRAYQVLGQTYATGSNQPMGLWNIFVTHTLRQTGPNYYVLADGEC